MRDKKDSISKTPKPRSAGLLRIVRTPRPPGSASSELSETHKGLARTQMNMLRLVPGPGGAPPPPVLEAPWQATEEGNLPWLPFTPDAGPDRLDDPSDSLAAMPNAPPAELVLAYATVDEGDQFVCRIEMPGVLPSQVDVVCFGCAILLHVAEAPPLTGALVQSERMIWDHGRFILLPAEIRTSDCRASLHDGVLTVNLPKSHPTDAPRRVLVKPRG